MQILRALSITFKLAFETEASRSCIGLFLLHYHHTIIADHIVIVPRSAHNSGKTVCLPRRMASIGNRSCGAQAGERRTNEAELHGPAAPAGSTALQCFHDLGMGIGCFHMTPVHQAKDLDLSKVKTKHLYQFRAFTQLSKDP